ncbi:hypothetical protein [Acidipila rosea]|uniref:Uncharacterized protein n=1 Tax=Acidipila rosea TaxID=768535 RepID=A0A4R1L6T6_9BACT|nr:hypothetical protein [Acidipila rosea]MBW4043553.1 hypothetical protein [Acidobacteriota bacterium]TCK73854.1 hypothetical protein C7378_1472 [Acidipila rosea]
MAAKKSKKKVFSTVKAVKANARERVGQPKPVRLIADKKHGARRKSTLQEMIDQQEP